MGGVRVSPMLERDRAVVGSVTLCAGPGCGHGPRSAVFWVPAYAPVRRPGPGEFCWEPPRLSQGGAGKVIRFRSFPQLRGKPVETRAKPEQEAEKSS